MWIAFDDGFIKRIWQSKVTHLAIAHARQLPALARVLQVQIPLIRITCVMVALSVTSLFLSYNLLLYSSGNNNNNNCCCSYSVFVVELFPLLLLCRNSLWINMGWHHMLAACCREHASHSTVSICNAWFAFRWDIPHIRRSHVNVWQRIASLLSFNFFVKRRSKY